MKDTLEYKKGKLDGLQEINTYIGSMKLTEETVRISEKIAEIAKKL
jgi:hypothetical protein